MRHALALAVTLAVVAAAFAEDPKPKTPPKPGAKSPPAAPASKDPVTLKVTPKRGDVIRFRTTESSSTEVDGNTYSAQDQIHEATITVVTPAEGGGYAGKLLLDRVYVKLGGRRPVEIDSAKPMPESTDLAVRAQVLMVQALTSAAFDVTVGADGALTQVAGVREALKAKVKGTLLESMLPVDEIASDAELLKLLGGLFAPLPADPHAPGAEWAHDAKDTVSAQPLDFAAKTVLTTPAADRALVASKYTWKPGAAATAGGAKAEGGGTVSALLSRTDGLALRVEKKLFANRTTDTMKATSHTDWTLERLTASGAPVVPAEAPKTPSPPKK